MRVFLATLLALGAARGAAAPVLADRLRGVRPELTAQLATASGVLCDRGSRRVPVDQFNDNYCDCEDGSDEPDCCDGSDEWSGRAACANTCLEAGRARREALAAAAAAHRTGLAERAKLVAVAAATASRHAAELESLEAAISQQQTLLASISAKKEAAEADEAAAKAAKDAEEAAAKAAADAAAAAADAAAAEAGAAGAAEGGEGAQAAAGGGSGGEGGAADGGDAAAAAEETEAERGQRIARQWTNDAAAAGTQPPPGGEAGAGAHGSPVAAAGDDGGDDGDDDDGDDDGDGGGGGGGAHPPPPPGGGGLASRLRRAASWLASLSGVASEAPALRSRHAKASAALAHLTSRRDALASLAAADAGPDRVWLALSESCVEGSFDGYTYSVCPFANATQAPGGTLLGRWAGFTAGGADGGPAGLSFTGGAHCWNGPARSLAVSLACGPVTALTGVAEPNRCEYEATLETPAACTPAGAAEAEALAAEAAALAGALLQQPAGGGGGGGGGHTDL